MMRSQNLNSGQASGQNENQKKSVFDRLGHQIDLGRPMKRRPSPGQYGDYGLTPPVHDPDYGSRYGGRDGRSQVESEWRYQNERRMMPTFPGRDRHMPPMQHPHPPAHYDMDMNNRPPYFPHPSAYHAGPQGGMPPPLPPSSGMPMPIHLQRSSPKYDRMPNVGPNFKHRGGSLRTNPIDHSPGISPPRNFLHPGSAPPHLGTHDMPPIAPDSGPMFPNSLRWAENVEPDYMMNYGNRMPGDQFDSIVSRRYKHQQMQQSQQPNQAVESQSQNHPPTYPNEAPRYTRWRERRDVITNLDRETARSSSRTDSLKSSLQQSDSKIVLLKSAKKLSNIDENLYNQNSSSSSALKKDPEQHKHKVNTSSVKELGPNSERDFSDDEPNRKSSSKTETQEISDGEIIDDEDSSDDEEQQTKGENSAPHLDVADNYLTNRNRARGAFGSGVESHHYYENGKKRRLIEREDYAMDYETISDEDLDDFMGDKKMSDEDVKLCNRNGDEKNSKNSSEIELLNALGLDWANLVEIAKQSKTSIKESSSPSSRFCMSNYLPTLGISADLAGPALYDLVMKTCRTNRDHYQ